MKRLLLLLTILIVGLILFRISERLSPDAIGMGLGVLFGILAGIPMALLMLAAERRREQQDEARQAARRNSQLGYGAPWGGLPPSPPVIILAGNGLPIQAQGPTTQSLDQYQPQLLPAPRQFRVVGEQQEGIDDFGN